jgi:hypothetical protein
MSPRADLSAVAERKIPSPYQESNPCRPVRSLVAIPTELPGSPATQIKKFHGWMVDRKYFQK